MESIFESVIPPSALKHILAKYGLMRGFVKYLFGKETKDDIINGVTNRKNEVLYDISINWKLKWLDINKHTNSMKFSHIDHIHFEKRAKEFIANKMLNSLKSSYV